MRILVLGAGAIGGYFGGRLREAGADVTFLVRPRRAELLAANGLRVRSPMGDIDQPVETLVAGGSSETFDLVMLSCKAYDLESAMDAIQPHLAADSAVLPLLNGINHIQVLQDRFGAERVLGGSCHIGVTLEPDGVIRHFNELQSLLFGELDGSSSTRVQTFAEIAGRAAFTARASDHIVQDLWDKIVFLASLAAATTMAEVSIGAITNCDDGAWFTGGLLDECAAIAASEGHGPAEKFVARSRGILADPNSIFTASMLRDMQAGGPTEADHILGDMVARGKRAGLDIPLLRTAYVRMQAYEKRRQ